MRLLRPIVLVLLASSIARAGDRDDFTALLESGERARRKVECERLVAQRDVEQRVRGHVCLAELATRSANRVAAPVRDPSGATFLREASEGPAVDTALEHLTAAIRLKPARLELHRDRLALLVRALRFEALPSAMGESISLVPKPQQRQLLSACLLPAMYQLAEEQRWDDALAVGRVLEKAYPDDHRVVANVGGILMQLGRDGEAAPYLERSVALAPKDPVNRWNLAQYHVRRGKLQDADREFATAVSLAKPAERADYGCRHAAFVEQMLHDAKRACALQQRWCPADSRPSCGAR